MILSNSRRICILTLVCCVCITAAPLYAQHQEDILDSIRQSYIVANVPDSTHFDSYLKRDLEDYFTSTGIGKPSVKWELLRKGATQSGVAYPKFYVWAWVYRSDSLFTQGAIRLAAVETTHFEVTQFVTQEEIRKDTSKIFSIFPSAVCAIILERFMQR